MSYIAYLRQGSPEQERRAIELEDDLDPDDTLRERERADDYAPVIPMSAYRNDATAGSGPAAA